MQTRQRRRTAAEQDGEGGVEAGLAVSIRNGEDLAPTVRNCFEIGKPEALLHQLKGIVKKKEVEIEELCKVHYEDFIRAVDELRGVLVDAEELKGDLSSENLRIQDVSRALLLRLEELLELWSVKKNVAAAMRTLKACVRLLNLCAKCNLHVSEGNFYPALKTIDLIESRYLQGIPVKSLRQVIEKSIPTMKSHVEKKVSHEFNDWLVFIRSTARQIGQVAIKHVESARQRDMEMRKQQAGEEADEEQNQLGYGDCAFVLDVEQDEDASIPKFDLTPVYRAHHIYARLGVQDSFLNYYYENRLMQLKLDLEISCTQPLLESHQALFAQIAGYFIVEERVLRTAGGLLSCAQVEALWEVAVTKLTSVLKEQVSSMGTANHLLLVKENVALLCETLKRCGYHVQPLLTVLDDSGDRYHELLLCDLRQRVAALLAEDTYEQMVVRKESEYNARMLAFNLQSSEIMPAFPYVAPFSSTVPDLCHLVVAFVRDAISYLSDNLANPHLVKTYLDNFLVKVLNEELLKLIRGGSLGVSQAMQLSANIAVLEGACDHFARQVAQLCGLPARATERPRGGLAAKAALAATQSAAYVALSGLVNSKIDDFMALKSSVNWIPEEPPQNGNECINEVIIYLDTVLSTAQQILPLDALCRIGRGALKHISDSIVEAFLGDDVKRFNVNAVMGIDADLKQLESFADERFQKAVMGDGGNAEDNFKDRLVEARQLINLLLSNQPENFMNPVIREKNYGALDYKKVATICEKFKDSPDRLFGSLSSRNTKQNARKKSMDVLKRRLRDFS